MGSRGETKQAARSKAVALFIFPDLLLFQSRVNMEMSVLAGPVYAGRQKIPRYLNHQRGSAIE
jgi:hypothetical protein